MTAMTARSLCLLACLVILSTSAVAAQASAEKGWWWYETPPPKKEKTDEPAQVVAIRPSLQEIGKMETDMFMAYAERAKKIAVGNPSEDNVRHYYEVQEVARIKAVAFTNASQLIWQKYPDLTVAKDYPLAAPGRNAVTREKTEERERYLASAKDDFALLYFNSVTCSFCREQEGILDYFVGRFGWQVKPIEINERPDLAEKFQIHTTPTLLLVRRGTTDFIPVTVGVAAASEIEEKLYRGIRLLRGEVNTEDFGMYEYQEGGGFDPKRERR